MSERTSTHAERIRTLSFFAVRSACVGPIRQFVTAPLTSWPTYAERIEENGKIQIRSAFVPVIEETGVDEQKLIRNDV